jgi:ubiquinone/menaquinone biosynthesis C-methylase UbiE
MNFSEWLKVFGYRQVPVWYQTSQETITEFDTIGKHLKILKFIPNPFPFYDWIMGFYERPSNRKALRGPVIERARKIIDVGVGTGYLLSQLISVTNEKQEIIAVDLSRQMLKSSQHYLQKKNLLTGRIHFAKANCLNLPWQDNTFDLYVSSYLFDLLPEKELRKAILHMERVLRPDGYAILITMTTELDGVNKFIKFIFRLMNEIYCFGYYRGRWNAVWKFLFAGYAPHCRPIELGKYLRESPNMIIAYTKVSRVSLFPVRIYYLQKSHD